MGEMEAVGATFWRGRTGDARCKVGSECTLRPPASQYLMASGALLFTFTRWEVPLLSPQPTIKGNLFPICRNVLGEDKGMNIDTA